MIVELLTDPLFPNLARTPTPPPPTHPLICNTQTQTPVGRTRRSRGVATSVAGEGKEGWWGACMGSEHGLGPWAHPLQLPTFDAPRAVRPCPPWYRVWPHSGGDVGEWVE